MIPTRLAAQARSSNRALQGAVVPGDVLGDDAPGGSAGGPGLVVEQLALERAEEALGGGVIHRRQLRPIMSLRDRVVRVTHQFHPPSDAVDADGVVVDTV